MVFRYFGIQGKKRSSHNHNLFFGSLGPFPISADMSLSPVLFIPHGGGPLPLLGDNNHSKLVDFLHAVSSELGKPSAILVISAHWEETGPTITSSLSPALIYDYSGFPEASYTIQYPAPGSPILARQVHQLLHHNGIEAMLDDQRGFDHGLFVPLKLIYPDNSIPCVQLSLVAGLDPALHIRIGNALSPLREKNILVLGSGFSFHNLRALLKPGRIDSDPENEAFEQWLIDTCTSREISEFTRTDRLIKWELAPSARYCHPREEHLLPLHVCYGIAQTAARLVFEDNVLGKKTSAFLW